MRISNKRVIGITVFVVLFLGGLVGGYLYLGRNFTARETVETAPQQDGQSGDLSFVRVFYPSEGRLVTEERKIKRQVTLLAAAEAIVDEFLKGPAVGRSDVPAGTKVLGIYLGSDGILYIDLSDEFRRNFRGDASIEFLLLKGLYESIISNLQGIDDVKILIEGKETESVGGHIFSLNPMKNTLTEAR